jgi:F-type H+-transporting ATPase subunit a
MENEIWLTSLFNKYLAAPGDTMLSWVGMKASSPGHPWANYVVMEIAVAAIIVVVFALLRPLLSMDRPGKFQHIFELIFGFLGEQTDDVVGHRGRPFMAFFGVLFIFILFANLIGLIPTFESPTMFPPVPLGLALATMLYYNLMGIKQQGLLHYLGHFAGPIWWLAPLMFPIEIISNLARPLSLTVRLYANMFGGEKVTMAFMGLIPLIIPIPFLGLHIFVGILQAYVFMLLTMVYVSEVLPHEEHATA